jgi:redox-sensitive bicupin YhaK (pirin superfamily)
MSNVEAEPAELRCGALVDDDGRPVGAPLVDVLSAREVPLGGPRAMRVRRTLPQRARALIGAWCFADLSHARLRSRGGTPIGPNQVTTSGGMDIAPHPHTGLQTVSWLFSGEVEHRDSLGTRALIRPGEMNLMTGGYGICHSEVSTPRTTVIHGVQLWVALPEEHRNADRDFQHYSWTTGPARILRAGPTAGAIAPGLSARGCDAPSAMWWRPAR